SMYGRPGFKDILRQLQNLWHTKREKVLDVAGNLARGLRADEVSEGAEPARGEEPPGPEVFPAAFEHAERTFDPVWGGFGTAPKFPRSIDLSLVLVHYHATGEKRELEMVARTLWTMAEGGLYTQ